MITDPNTIRNEIDRITGLFTKAYLPISATEMDLFYFPRGADGLIIVKGKNTKRLLQAVRDAVKEIGDRDIDHLVVFTDSPFLKMKELVDLDKALSTLHFSSYEKGLNCAGTQNGEGQVSILFNLHRKPESSSKIHPRRKYPYWANFRTAWESACAQIEMINSQT